MRGLRNLLLGVAAVALLAVGALRLLAVGALRLLTVGALCLLRGSRRGGGGGAAAGGGSRAAADDAVAERDDGVATVGYHVQVRDGRVQLTLRDENLGVGHRQLRQADAARLPGGAGEHDSLLEHGVKRGRGNLARGQGAEPVLHRGVHVTRADVAQDGRVHVAGVCESTRQHPRERSPRLGGRVGAQDGEGLPPLGQRAGLDQQLQVLGYHRGRDAHVRPADVGGDVLAAGLLPQVSARDVGEDERVGVASRGDARVHRRAVVADDERALRHGVVRVHVLDGLGGGRGHGGSPGRRRPSRGDRLGGFRDWLRRGGGRGRRGGLGDPAVRVHIVEEGHAVISGRGWGEGRGG